MKKVILASVAAAASLAGMSAAYGQAGTTASVCAAPTAAGSGTSIASGSYFVKTGFTPKCSANVYLVYDQDTTFMRVGAASGKGGRSFMGSTAGGSVVSSATCTSCTQSNASAAATNANNPTSG